MSSYGLSGTELVAHFHQREAEQVQPLPTFRSSGTLVVVVGSQPDAPDPVPRGSLDDDPAADAGQRCDQS